MDRETAKAELAADVLEALAIAFGQLLLRALLQPADRDHDNSHECCFWRVLACTFPARAFKRALSRLHAPQPICIGRAFRSLPPPGFAPTTFRDCRIHAPRV